MLSEAARSVWGKSDRETNGRLPLYVHLADTAGVALRLWDEWLPGHVKNRIARDLGGDTDLARKAAVWLASAHDLGKASRAFAVQVPALADAMRANGLDVRPFAKNSDRAQLPHSLASYYILKDWLVASGWSKRVAVTYAAVVGSHHGTTPSERDADLSEDRLRDLLGTGEDWIEVRGELSDYAAQLAVDADDLVALSTHALSIPTQLLLTALVIVADWIASDPERFPYGDARPSAERAKRAWDELGLTRAWRPQPPERDADEFMRTRFGRTTARPVQRGAIDAAWSVKEPDLMIIEAAMGDGKTEAALAVAEILAARFGLGGIFLALPTMATSDAMFGRVLAWLRGLPTDRGGPQSTFLAHSKASLNPDLDDLVRAGRITAVGDDFDETSVAEALIAHQWLFGRKKGPLANFVVGTIDQVLMSGLKVKHLMLRQLALANKVVVIDEAHSFDEYMNSYLETVLSWLGAFGTPVVVLSATLPEQRCSALIAAYQSGRGSQPTSPERSEGYPIVTVADADETWTIDIPADSSNSHIVSVEPLADGDSELLAAIDRALKKGGCVGIIRDVVARAQNTYDLVRGHLEDSIPVVLAHSRFIANDRMRNDRGLRETFGPSGPGVRRPQRAVVVGTQVLEQSLDIDFDLLITDLAPMDLLLQRIGRLHRHTRPDRQITEARCLITGVDWEASPPRPAKAISSVYGDYPLLRALVVLESRFSSGGELDLPREIPTLVAACYGAEKEFPSTWSETVAKAELDWDGRLAKKRNSAKAFQVPHPSRGRTIVGFMFRDAGNLEDDSPEAQAQVRDTEPSLEVLCLQRRDGLLRTMPSLGGEVVETGGEPRQRIAKAIANSSIRLPTMLSTDTIVTQLERENGIASWQKSRWLGGELLLVFDEQLRASLGGSDLEYSAERGLVLVRRGGKKDG